MSTDKNMNEGTKLLKMGCVCRCTIKVDGGITVGDILPNGAKIMRIKELKNGQRRVETELWYDNDNDYKEPELLKFTYQTY